MKTTVSYKIWQVFYPVGIYYVVSSLMYFALEYMIGTAQETYMLRQLICSSATIPFILSFYMQDRKMRGESVRRSSAGSSVLTDILLPASAAAALGIAVNNILAMTPLMQMSQGFSEANDAFFGGQLIYELLGSCLLIPMAEELLFRGVVYGRLRMFMPLRFSLMFSALIFGLVHANLVQFLYAGILGLLLAFCLEQTGRLSAAVLGHIAANTVAGIRQETGWLYFSYQKTVAGIGFTAGMLLTAAALVAVIYKTGGTDRSVTSGNCQR